MRSFPGQSIGQFFTKIVKESIHVGLRLKVGRLDKLARGNDPPELDHRLILLCLAFLSFPRKILLDLGQCLVFQADCFGLSLADMRETIVGCTRCARFSSGVRHVVLNDSFPPTVETSARTLAVCSVIFASARVRRS